MKRKIIFFSLVIIIIGSFFIYTIFSNKTDFVSYSFFAEQMKANSIETSIISEETIKFTLKDGNQYLCQNPKSPDLAERLLLSGTAISFEKNVEEKLVFILDILFYIIFAIAIIFIYKRFISPSSFKVAKKTQAYFSDIVGMEDVKKAALQVVDMLKKPNFYQRKGIRIPKGILLEGDPGNGKTLFARALANEAGIKFIPTKATDFESMFMAIGPMKVKMLFRKARKNAPCIVFIDEFDGIGTKRNYSGNAIETENTRIVTALLNELDGFQVNSGVLVVAATNSIKALDEALVRPGRFDSKFYVPYPDKNARLALIEKYTGNKQLDSMVSKDKLAEKLKGASCAYIESLLNNAALLAQSQGQDSIQEIHIAQAAKEM